jgi:pimeloyl-ACP methyl ester carboxylesterase
MSIGRIGKTALALLLVAASTIRAQAAGSAKAAKPTIVLVHGAFADASSFQYLIPLLQKDGYNVVAVQNPLSSVPDDIATTKRLLSWQKGPVVLVGHSYGGVVISGAATGNPNVKALVYLAAFAPEANEPAGPLNDKYTVDLGKHMRPDPDGYLYIECDHVHELFAADLPRALPQWYALRRSQFTTRYSVHRSAHRLSGRPFHHGIWCRARITQLLNLERFYAKRMKSHHE